MGLVAAATLVVTTWAAAAGVGRGLEIEAGTPDDLCPALAATEAAVRGRLGGVVREGEGTWKARYSTWYAPDAPDGGGRVLRLEIVDPAGKVQQTKDIAAAGASCESLAHAIAVVVDLYFRRPDPAAVPSAAPSELPLLRVGAGAGPQNGGLGVAVDVGVRIARRATLNVGLSLPRRYESEAVGAGGAELRSLPVRLGVALALPSLARWRFELGPEALLLIDTAETYELSQTQQSTRLVFGLGAAGTARLALGAWSLGLTGGLAAPLPLDTSKLVVLQQGDEVEVLRPPRAVARLMLAVSYGFFFQRGP